MKLRYMSRGLLVMFAGGDPWKADATLQSGRPAQIADLGEAFHNAGRSTQEADKAFTEARGRVDFWIGDNGQHPITDSAEIRRTATALGLQASQLPKIAVDLENVAAALAQTQGTADADIKRLGGSAANSRRLDRPGRRHDQAGRKPPCPSRRR